VLAQRRAANRQNGNGNALPPMFMTLRGGMQQLTDALVARLDANALWTKRRVVTVTRQGNLFAIALNDGQRVQADAVVFATPAYVTADLVRELDPTLAAQLQQIRYVSSATVSLGFKSVEVKHPLNGSGFVVARSDKRKIIACSWSSCKFNHRAPADHVLMRAFVGGAQAELVAEQDEVTLVQMIRDELQTMMGITATPVLARVSRWHKANPQYEVGHQARVAEIETRAAEHPNLHLAGSAYRGVGIPDCIQDGTRAAQEILNHFPAVRGAPELI
jgi:oxygen-dependent protoporphyrinogen oxidase